jgi:hypothetical protein
MCRDQGNHGDTHEPADERVDHPFGTTRPARRNQGRDQHRGVSGLHGEDGTAVEGNRSSHCDRDHERDLPRPAADCGDEKIADTDADGHAAHQLDGTS